MLDRGARGAVVLGCALAAVGSPMGEKVTQLEFSTQNGTSSCLVRGSGSCSSPASTDAVNSASSLSYGEATGITQTVRNYAASLGLAILGTILLSQFHSHVTTSLIAKGVPATQAASEASSLSQSQGQSGSTASIPHFIRLDFADATRTVFYVMAGIMAVAAIVAFIGLPNADPERSGRRECRVCGFQLIERYLPVAQIA